MGRGRNRPPHPHQETPMPRNPTTRDIADLGLMAMAVGGGAAIKHMEEEGQRDIQNYKEDQKIHLPKRIDESDKLVLKVWGWTLGDPVEGDDLFIHATMPEGWTLKKTSHHMYTDVL